MLNVLVQNTVQILLQALLVGMVAAVGKLLSWLVKIRFKKPRPYRFRIDPGMASLTVVITVGGTRQEREALIDAKSDGRDS